MRVRRVVTGHDRQGKAFFASDTQLDAITSVLQPGSEFHRLWGGNITPSFPDDGSAPEQDPFFPPVGGFRFLMFTLPPRSHSRLAVADEPAARAAFEAALPGMASVMEKNAPGMHTTATIDFLVVLEGEVFLELDDGAVAHLRTGDSVVQNGTRHAWHNRGSKPARLVGFCVGAQHAKFPSS